MENNLKAAFQTIRKAECEGLNVAQEEMNNILSQIDDTIESLREALPEGVASPTGYGAFAAVERYLANIEGFKAQIQGMVQESDQILAQINPTQERPNEDVV